MEKRYCKCINPIFEHQRTQDEYLGFKCVECGGELKDVKLTTVGEIVLFLIFGLPIGIIAWVLLL